MGKCAGKRVYLSAGIMGRKGRSWHGLIVIAGRVRIAVAVWVNGGGCGLKWAAAKYSQREKCWISLR